MDQDRLYFIVDEVLSHFIDEDTKSVHMSKYDIQDFKDILSHALRTELSAASAGISLKAFIEMISCIVDAKKLL